MGSYPASSPGQLPSKSCQEELPQIPLVGAHTAVRTDTYRDNSLYVNNSLKSVSGNGDPFLQVKFLFNIFLILKIFLETGSHSVTLAGLKLYVNHAGLEP